MADIKNLREVTITVADNGFMVRLEYGNGNPGRFIARTNSELMMLLRVNAFPVAPGDEQ